jgi:hypothetical protein
MQPIFQQYANLYPVMQRFLNLASYDDICAHRNLQLLRMAFSLNESDPNVMPVTRDLSGAKRKAILKWLTDVGADGKPLLGARVLESLPPANRATSTLSEHSQSPSIELPPSLLEKGGKSVAMSRRLGLLRSDTKEAK